MKERYGNMESNHGKLFTNELESLDRLAWTQTLEQGMGSGIEAFNHKQPRKADAPLQRDYYVRSRGHH